MFRPWREHAVDRNVVSPNRSFGVLRFQIPIPQKVPLKTSLSWSDQIHELLTGLGTVECAGKV